MMMAPIAAAVAALDPEIAAKKPQATTATIARPPDTCPSITLQKLISRREMPPELIRLPASTKNGIAIKVNPDEPEKIRCATMARSISLPSAIASSEEPPRVNAMGRPRNSSTKKHTNKIAIIPCSPTLSRSSHTAQTLNPAS